jgi:hypothetical protein
MQKITKKLQRNFLCQKWPKFAKFLAILGAFYLATKIRILAWEDRIFFIPQKKGQRVGSLNPNPWIRNNTTTIGEFLPLVAGLAEGGAASC